MLLLRLGEGENRLGEGENNGCEYGSDCEMVLQQGKKEEKQDKSLKLR